jgi:site-specific DNA recombinase
MSKKLALRAQTRARTARRSTMRVAAYVRVSTSRQVKLQTIDQQLEMVSKYAREEGWELAGEDIFRDDGYIGTTLKRPALDALRDKARMREFEAVVVASPDRLARNYVHQMVLVEEFEKVGCKVEFVERPMSSEPNDQLLLQIRGAVAEYERTLLSERMRRGRLAKYKAGLLLPWTHTPYGLRVDPDRPSDPAGVRPEEAKAAVVAEIFAAYLEPGATLLGVSRHLRDMGVPAPRGGKAWSTATLLRGILTNPVYTGKVYAGRVRYRPARIRRSATHPIGHPHNSSDPLPEEEWIFIGEVPEVVAQEHFDLVAQKLSKNKSFARRNNKANEHLLRALVSCAECMLASIAVAKTFGKNNDRKQRYYVCSGKFNKAQSTPEEKCSSRYAPAEQLEEIVWKDLCEVLTHPESITDALRRAHGGEWLPQELKARQENLRKGRSALGSQLERLTEAYLGEVIPLAEYQRRRKDLEQRDESHAAQERQLRSQSRQRMELVGVAGSIEDFCERVGGGLAEATFEQKRKLVELLIDRVIVTGEEVEIRYVIPTDPSSEHVRFCHLRSDYLHHPPPRQHHEPFRRQQFLPIYGHAFLGPFPGPPHQNLFGGGLFRTLHQIHAPAQGLLHPVCALVLPAVARVQPQMREAGKPLLGSMQQCLDPFVIHNLRAVYPGS